jgi:hypothetical protein
MDQAFAVCSARSTTSKSSYLDWRVTPDSGDHSLRGARAVPLIRGWAEVGNVARCMCTHRLMSGRYLTVRSITRAPYDGESLLLRTPTGDYR